MYEQIILHHSYSKDHGILENTKDIRRWHTKERGFSDIGYNEVLESVDGKLRWVMGRPYGIPGAHCKENRRNHTAIGLCIVGNFDKGHDTLSEEHIRLIHMKIAELREKFGKHLTVEPHNMHAPYKSCPGTGFPMDLFTGAVDWKTKIRTNKDIQDKEMWIKRIEAAVRFAEDDIHLGELEGLKYLPNLIEKL